MSDETPPSTRYHRLAQEALGAANAMLSGKEHDALLQMAQVWERLARQHADATASLTRPEGEQQAAMQQQQQIQSDSGDTE